MLPPPPLIYVPVEEIARDGTVWTPLKPGIQVAGRLQQQNILKEIPGPSSHAKRNFDGTVRGTFNLLIDEPLLRHIQQATVVEARRQLQSTTWSMPLDELNAFLAILYARGAYGAKGLSIKSLWSSTWGPQFFPDTMSRNRSQEIMKYLQFI